MAILLYLFLCIVAGVLAYVATKKISLALLAALVLLMHGGLEYALFAISQ
jgi:hypothetical protein